MKIDVSGLRQVQEMARRSSLVKERIRDLSPIAKDLAQIVRDDIDRRFQSSPSTEVGGVVFGGVSWNKLTDYTLKRHPHRKGGKVLIDTGEMRQECISDSGMGNRYYTQVPGFFTYILRNKKAVENQEKRPILVAHRELLDEVATKTLDYALEEES